MDRGPELDRHEVPVSATGGRSETQGQSAETPNGPELNKTARAERGASGIRTVGLRELSQELDGLIRF